jgi:uncharacterized Ntn-hydrolase superfamily protein
VFDIRQQSGKARPRAQRSRFALLLGASAAGLCFWAAAPASATYSIVAADRATRQVGGAGTSCIGGQDVYIIYGSVPGTGAVHAQAQFSMAGRNRAVQLLGQAQSPQQIIQAITANAFDNNAASRQYGVVDVTGRSAGFTGGSTLPFADDVQGTIGTFAFSVQGNILTSEAVLTQARSAFEAPACDLAARLMAALEAGGDNGEGDSRCTGDGIPSDSAYLQVDVPDAAAGSFLSLRVPTSGDENPLPLLRAQFDAWRLTSPCPAPVDAGASDASTPAPGSAQDAGTNPTPSGTVPREPTGAGGTPALDAAPEPPSAGAGTSADTPRRPRGGCNVTHGNHTPIVGVLICGLAAVVLRRRRVV